jgi:hypothetical protein
MLEAHMFVAQVAADLPRTRRAWLVEGPCSRWLYEPAAGTVEGAGEPPGAGVKWLIDQQVERFVKAGAFGLLRAWLSELRRQIGQNKAWVATREKQKYLSRRPSGLFEIEQGMDQLRQMADSFLSRLFHPELDDMMEGISLEARDRFDFLLWEAKLQAIVGFYDVVVEYLASLEHATNQIVRWLDREAETGTLRARRNDVLRTLEERSAQDDGASPDATWYAGADRSNRDELLQILENHPGAGKQTLLSSQAGSNERLFLTALGDARAWFGPMASRHDSEEEKRAAREAYIRNLRHGCRTGVDAVLAPSTTVEEVLLREAHALLVPYRETRRAGSTADTRQRMEFRDRLKRRLGSQIMGAIEHVEWNEGDDAFDEAVRLYLAGRLGTLIHAAAPQWALRHAGNPAQEPFGFRFVTLPRRARRLVEAMAMLRERFLGPMEPQIHVGTTGKETRFEVLNVEMNAGLDDMDMWNELALYEHVLGDPDRFPSPHTTREYAEAGRAYLESRLDRRDG